MYMAMECPSLDCPFMECAWARDRIIFMEEIYPAVERQIE